jgi:hypothetical protein
MSVKYSEIIINAPFLLVKGFLMGFMHGREESFGYFFHRKAGIRRETVGEMLRKLLHFESHTHLCLPVVVLSSFKAALKRAEPVLDIKIESEREIKKAEFGFSFNIYNENQTELCKALFENLPEGIELEGFAPEEQKDEHLVGVKEYAPLHPYVYRGHGHAHGPFSQIMKFYLDIKKCEISDFILCSDIRLFFK